MEERKKMGPISQLVDRMSGMGKIKDEINQEDADKSMRKMEALIRSMTGEERRNPKVLNASRKKRIARGAGYYNTDKHPEHELEGIQEINQLIKQLREMQKMLKIFKVGPGPD